MGSPQATSDEKHIENVVAKLFREDAEKHRLFIERIVTRSLIILGTTATLLGTIFVFWFGDSRKAMNAEMREQVAASVADYQIDQNLRKRLVEITESVLSGKGVQEQVESTVGTRVREIVEATALPKIQEITRSKIEELGNIKAESLIYPIGAIVAFWGPLEKKPIGWLPCDGQSIPQEFKDLIALVGPRTPDLRGLFLRGLDNGRNVDPGRTLGGPDEVQEDAFKSHKHTGPQRTAINNGQDNLMRVFMSGSAQDGAGDFSTNEVGGPETRPKNFAVNYIIKT